MLIGARYFMKPCPIASRVACSFRIGIASFGALKLRDMPSVTPSKQFQVLCLWLQLPVFPCPQVERPGRSLSISAWHLCAKSCSQRVEYFAQGPRYARRSRADLSLRFPRTWSDRIGPVLAVSEGFTRQPPVLRRDGHLWKHPTKMDLLSKCRLLTGHLYSYSLRLKHLKPSIHLSPPLRKFLFL